MKRFFLLLVLISSISYGQTLDNESLIGIWKVEKVIGNFPKMTPDQQKRIDSLKSAFLKATFEFKANNRFNLNIKFVSELDKMMKDVHWKFNPNTMEIIIQEWKDKDTDKSQLMEILVSKKNGRIFFVLTESPFVFEMKKI